MGVCGYTGHGTHTTAHRGQFSEVGSLFPSVGGTKILRLVWQTLLPAQPSCRLECELINSSFQYHYSSLFSIAVVKHHDQKHLGEERFTSVYGL